MKSVPYCSFVLISLAIGALGPACNRDNPCFSLDGALADQGPATELGLVDAATPSIDLAYPTITVNMSDWTTVCTTAWQTSAGSLQFTGTNFFNSCGYGFGIECSATSKNPVDISALSIFPLRVELSHKYDMVSGVNAPPLGAPMAIRILRGELRVYDHDPQVNPSSPLGVWAITGSQTSPVRTSFHLDATNKRALYFTVYTRLDCSQYPPPQSQAWTWSISRLRIFPDFAQ